MKCGAVTFRTLRDHRIRLEVRGGAGVFHLAVRGDADDPWRGRGRTRGGWRSGALASGRTHQRWSTFDHLQHRLEHGPPA